MSQHSTHTTAKSQSISSKQVAPSPPVVQAKATELTPEMPEWKPSEAAYHVDTQNPLGGLYGHTAPSISIQAKLTVGEVNDPYEQEADRVAAQVVETIHAPAAPPTPVQRSTDETEEAMQLQAITPLTTPNLQKAGLGGGAVSSEIESQIQSAKGSGQALDPTLQRSMGEAMGADFSGVKIHTDSQSDQLNQSVQAKAFTTGQDVFFKQGAYDPSSKGGQELIAHELTHVVQQTGSSVQRKEAKSKPSTTKLLQSQTNKLSKSPASGVIQDVIQAWPNPEVSDQPDPGLFPKYKCHDAVIYWVLRSLPDIKTSKDAIDALLLLQKKRGSSAYWIAEALGYGSGKKIQSASEAAAGDILFTGALSYIAHTMVVVDANNIVGFNNFGTFGTPTGGDQYSTEEFANQRFWHDIEGDMRMGFGRSGTYPVFKVAIGTAQAALSQFVDKVSREADYKGHMDPEIKEDTGCCFITTACIKAKGLPDDCEELTVLRQFRDGYMSTLDSGSAMITEYYQIAPRIVSCISALSNGQQIFVELYDQVAKSVNLVKAGDNKAAMENYIAIVRELKDRYL